MRHSVGFAVAILIALPSFSAAQSLAEAAAREREKRKGQKAGKVITEDELRRAGRGPGTANVSMSAPDPAASPAASGQAQPAGATQAGAAPKAKTDDEVRAEQEQAWRDKLKTAQEDVLRLTQAATALQNSLNDLSGNVYGSQRTNLMNQLEKTKAELQAAQAQVATLQDEGRRSRFR
jgi:hypothetical protein